MEHCFGLEQRIVFGVLQCKLTASSATVETWKFLYSMAQQLKI